MERQAAKHFGVPAESVDMRFAGLNHLSFATKLYINGEDKTADFIEHMGGMERFTSANIPALQFEKGFLKALNLIPSSYLLYYYKKDDMLKKALDSYNKGENRAQLVMKLESELFEIYKDANLDVKPQQLEKRGGAFYSEAACRLIESLYTNKKDIQPVVTRNNGAIPFLPDDAAVEVSCVIGRNGPVPLSVGRALAPADGLISMVKSFETLVIDAAVERNFEKAVLALAHSPFTLSEFAARKVVEEMSEAHRIEWKQRL
jgi:6-phospho-beta-glucosidase